MNADIWQCPKCRHRVESQFQACWRCGYARGSGGDETVSPDPSDAPDTRNPISCSRCDLELDYVGTKKFHEGSRAAPFLLGEIGELFVKREHFDVYVCPRCGRVELFVDGIGEEFRNH